MATPTLARAAMLSLLVSIGARAARAEEAHVAAARLVFEKHQDSVVWVSAVMKMRAGGGLGAMFGRQEQKVEAVGTVIHESGLTVLSYTMLDPSAMLNAAMAGAGGGEEDKVEFKTELSGVKIRLGDGTEVAARLVLRDDDLDLAFVMPTEQGKKLPHLALGGGAAAAEAPAVKPLDPLVVIWRLGQALDRQPAVAMGRVSAVVSKPRTFYLVSGLQSLGTPAFTVDGRPLGIVVMRRQSGEGALGGMFSAAASGGVAAVVVPAADVMEVAQQALEGKGKTAEEAAPADDAKAPEGGTNVPPGGTTRRGQ